MLSFEILDRREFGLIGAGTLGNKIYRNLIELGLKPKFIADNTLSECKDKNNHYLITYEQLKKINNKQILLIVTIFNPKASFKSIKTELIEFGFNNVHSFTELFEISEDTFLPFLNYVPTVYYKNEEIQIEKFRSKLFDEKSKIIYNSNLEAKCFNLELNIPADNSSYFPKELFPDELFKHCLYIDCGAFDGDSVLNFIELHNEFGQIFALEPDITNFQKLLLNVFNLDSKFKKKVFCINSGVSDECNVVNFSGEKGMNSKIEENGKNIAQLIKLDDLIKLNSVNEIFIKLDIEGNEYNALMGMEHIIKEFSPNLAISVYHKYDDIWNIGSLIDSLNQSYNFYLRQHGNDGMDLILYCLRKL